MSRSESFVEGVLALLAVCLAGVVLSAVLVVELTAALVPRGDRR